MSFESANKTCPFFLYDDIGSACLSPSTPTPWYYSSKPSLVPSPYTDQHLALATPLIAYWALSLLFQYLDSTEWKWLDKYRIHESAEMKKRNRVSKQEVVWMVIFQQSIQTALGLWWVESEKPGIGHAESMRRIGRVLEVASGWVLSQDASKHALGRFGPDLVYFIYWWGIPAVQFLGAIFFIDTWQYFLHRLMHIYPVLYRNFHSVHHRLYVPYAFGALYNHPLEGFVLDTLGALLAESITCMSTRQASLLFGVATLKTVDDHCGYKLPWDPLQMLSSNNADYHDIHHQQIGIKSNFAQPFFVHWDSWLGTRMTREDMARKKAARNA